LALPHSWRVFREEAVQALASFCKFAPPGPAAAGSTAIVLPGKTGRAIAVNLAKPGLQNPTFVGFFAFENRTQT
jgi:hypothetical protein